jgi:acyl-CoA thioesterase I
MRHPARTMQVADFANKIGEADVSFSVVDTFDLAFRIARSKQAVTEPRGSVVARSIRSALNWSRISASFCALIVMVGHLSAEPLPIQIVAIGASNTMDWGVLPYPERLEQMLKGRGYKVHVTNSGALLDTTARMLKRIDTSVPYGTRVVILQPGGNDLRFFGSKQQRAANIAAMVKRLRARRIKVIVFDPIIPPQYYQWDGIHITAEGHAMFASKLLPQVISAIEQNQ